MKLPVITGLASRMRRRALQTRVSSLILLLQRSPLVKILLPEARVISSSGFSEGLKWTVTAIAGLGAYDSVSGATAVVQVSPTANASTVNFTAGAPLTFFYQMTGGGGHVPATFTIHTGSLPAGLTRANLTNSTTDFISGTPTQVGTFPITLRAWENTGGSGRFAAGSFSLVVTAPPVPTITSHPVPVASTAGSFVKLTVGNTNGQTFTWRKNGVALPAAESVVLPRSSSKKWFIPTADPGTAWRTDPAFVDTSWTSVTANPNGKAGVGFDSGGTVDYSTEFGNGGTLPSGKGFAYIRIPFTVTTPAALSYLKFRFQCDDGYVAWLNGTQIGSSNPPATLVWNSLASASTADATAITRRKISLPQSTVSLLKTGTNVLAIQALNQSVTSSDLLFNCELAGGINATNSSTLVLPALSLAETGSYSVLVNNFTVPAGLPSLAAPVHILPAVVAHPQGSTIDAGQTAQLSVTGTGSALTYQWYQGPAGDTASPVPGATDATFTTPALSATTTYWVRVSNPGGTADSSAATVTVNAVMPPSITTQPAGTSVNFNQSAHLAVTAGGTGPFTYQWYQGNAPDTTTLLSGATGDAFDTPALTATTSYWVRVSNAGGSTDSATATVTVLVQPPTIATQPAGATVSYNQSVPLSVTPGGTGPFTYQWYQGTAGSTLNPVAQATDASFTTLALTASATYWVRVSNGGGSVDSQEATVTVIDNIDAWRASVFTPAQLQDASISGPAADPDGDGITNEAEYVFGSLPLTYNQPPQLVIVPEGAATLKLSYPTLPATGPGYANRTRSYLLDGTDNPAVVSGWAQANAGAPQIAPDGTSTLTIPIGTASHRYYRLRVQLQ